MSGASELAADRTAAAVDAAATTTAPRVRGELIGPRAWEARPAVGLVAAAAALTASPGGDDDVLAVQLDDRGAAATATRESRSASVGTGAEMAAPALGAAVAPAPKGVAGPGCRPCARRRPGRRAACRCSSPGRQPLISAPTELVRRFASEWNPADRRAIRRP
jgi:hypothetical protein